MPFASRNDEELALFVGSVSLDAGSLPLDCVISPNKKAANASQVAAKRAHPLRYKVQEAQQEGAIFNTNCQQPSI
ncbi:hypothetical protein CHS0354_040870 [Potamilus streckersoni]|uniref:Uncharacterized protein n=1 Tax=Potamilus streckersoni TaxID=2493646 RepID=A0AAE0VXD5_9BIVA|nr:hypothetical protein CHS0354_040870 [Potamilus streckersoni]